MQQLDQPPMTFYCAKHMDDALHISFVNKPNPNVLIVHVFLAHCINNIPNQHGHMLVIVHITVASHRRLHECREEHET